MQARDLLDAIGIDIADDIEVTAIVTDSKKVIKNCIFICLCGFVYSV